MSSSLTFGRIKRAGAILIAIVIVLVAGIIVGQAPAIFGVEEDPEASIEFEDQQNDGNSVTITEVTLSDGGFVVISDGNNEPLAVSEYLESGSHENVTVEGNAGDGELVGQLTATVHRDTNGDETYAYEESDGEEDRPYLEKGFPVSDTAAVTTGADEGVSDSFAVDAMSAPDSATTDETIVVTAEITNPTDTDIQQPVVFRIDGTVVERQIMELAAGESTEIRFEIDMTGTEPGERTIGVYSEADGELDTLNLEFHTEPTVEVTDRTADNVTATAAIPVDGFVAIEDADGSVIGASEALGPGEHENVSLAFDDEASVDAGDELTAVLYEGDPDERDSATPFEHEGERVETTFTVDAASDDGAGDDGDG